MQKQPADKQELSQVQGETAVTHGENLRTKILHSQPHDKLMWLWPLMSQSMNKHGQRWLCLSGLHDKVVSNTCWDTQNLTAQEHRAGEAGRAGVKVKSGVKAVRAQDTCNSGMVGAGRELTM